MRANLEAFARWRIRPADAHRQRRSATSPSRCSACARRRRSCSRRSACSRSRTRRPRSAWRKAAAVVGRADACSRARRRTRSKRSPATDAPRWFQLYWVNDREICASFVRRAEEAGYGAIVVTLDTLTLGWRPRDLRQAYLPFIRGEGCGQFFSDPVFLSRLDKPPEEDLLTAAATMLATFPNLGLTWDDLDWLRGQTTLPILVKGVLTADDAQLALRARRRRRDRLEPRRPPGRRRRRRARRARRGARRAARRGRADGRRHPLAPPTC